LEAKVNCADGSNYNSFKAPSFEALDRQIKAFLAKENKKVLSISAYYNGEYHHAMIATSPLEVVISNGTSLSQAQLIQGNLCVRTC